MFEFKMPQESLAKAKMKNSSLKCPEPAATVQNVSPSKRAADLQETWLKREYHLLRPKSAKGFCTGPESKQFRLCRTYSLFDN